MVGRTSDWKGELGHFLRPLLHRLGHKARRQMCPLYVSGLIGQRWFHFLTQPAKMDSPMQRMIYNEEAETVFG